MTGTWTININTSGMPQKVATATAKLNETLIGAEYMPIAYIGSQIVNGINHAVLMEQVLTTARDTKNVVLVVFNEKEDVIDLTLVSIEQVINGTNDELGGINVNPTTNIPEDVSNIFNAGFVGFTGSAIKPFAFLATQVVKGTDYIFAVEIAPIVHDPVKRVGIVSVNAITFETNINVLI